MKSARNQLILLGLIGQGFSWNDYGLPWINALLWWLCVGPLHGRIRFTPPMEGVLLALGCAAGYWLSRSLDQSAHFFIGHGLALVQLARLLRPLTPREKVFSVVIAFFHFGVACTIVMDYRFMLLLLAAIAIIPRALLELNRDAFVASGVPPDVEGGHPAARTPAKNAPATDPLSQAPPFRRAGRHGSTSGKLPDATPFGPRISLASYGAIVAVMALFFVMFPRGFLAHTLPAHRLGRADDASLADMVLDPARSASAQSGRIILQIEGENIGYLRCLPLVHFDGNTWSADRLPAYYPVPPPAAETPANYPYRRVRVKDVAMLGRVLPTDGQPVHVRGQFFRQPRFDRHGLFHTDAMWNTPNNAYEYWIRAEHWVQPLTPQHTEFLQRHPEPSPRLRAWLEQRLEGSDDPYLQARQLEAHFRDQFTYELGAPELDRLDHLDDFIFNQRRGHCERFASALGLLLRMQGIPTRVMVGYVPGPRNPLTGWQSVRFRDAHAWTEAWFPDRGWVELDATPRASISVAGAVWRDLLEALDIAWYTQVVNFDSSAQKHLVTVSLDWAQQLSTWADENHRALVAVLFLALAFCLAVYGAQRWQGRRRTQSVQQRTRILAGHYYGRMLRALAQRGFHRQPQQTPWEFLAVTRPAFHEGAAEMELITRLFCATRYGGNLLTPEQQREVETALARLRPH